MKRLIFVLIPLIFILSCSSGEESAKDDSADKQEIYVFDDVTQPVDSTAQIDTTISIEPAVVSEEQKSAISFFVQVGAFTNQERADRFVQETKDLIKYEMTISYSEEVKLFVVQLPPFSSREEAETVRNQCWEIPAFKDAFILTVQ